MPTVAELKAQAMTAWLKSLPKGKKALNDYVAGMTMPKDVKEIHDHLKEVDCKVVPAKEVVGMKSKKQALEHLEKKACPEHEKLATPKKSRAKKTQTEPVALEEPKAPGKARKSKKAESSSDEEEYKLPKMKKEKKPMF